MVTGLGDFGLDKFRVTFKFHNHVSFPQPSVIMAYFFQGLVALSNLTSNHQPYKE